MDYLPIFLDLKNKPVLLVGGGAIALRKARLLCRAGAIVEVVAPDVDQALESLVGEHDGSVVLGNFKPKDIEDKALVVAATDNEKINAEVSALCHARHVPVNVVDNPALCSFIMPSIVDRSPLMIAISSGGQSPVLARLLRSAIESMIPAAYGKLAEFVGRFRDTVKDKLGDERVRRHFWENVLEGPVGELVLAGKQSAAESMLQQQLNTTDPTGKVGEVYLVGAGPGDPDLLTFRALRLMQSADVVLYDRLVSQPILDKVRRDAELIYVGKARNQHTLPQDDINTQLIRLAKQGKRVVRLKGGDPFIFGRGGEEIEGLAREGIPFQVIPGITAASGCACYAGIPLTHRDYAQSVRFITGHLKDGSIDLEWDQLVSVTQTVVFYMGLVGLRVICSQLIAHGRDAGTPIALVEKGTTPQQRVITGTLATLPDIVGGLEVHAPTLLIVGEVVKLHGNLGWFNKGT
jgi:uroporphyrin-III C-methyltransferase/precorrin-2 dehydrogenase/sirohydrochlorin ferrochelatase